MDKLLSIDGYEVTVSIVCSEVLKAVVIGGSSLN
jgi:hypothetical protein